MDTVVLLIEDNQDDIYLVQEALKMHSVDADLIVLEDGEKAIGWIQDNDNSLNGIRPVAIILDLNLPKREGAVVLDLIRASRSVRLTPVIIFSSSSSYSDRSLAGRYPSTTYFRKPADFDEFSKIGSVVKRVLETSV